MSEFRMKPRCLNTVGHEFYKLPKETRIEIANRFGLLEGLEQTTHVSVWMTIVLQRAKERRKWAPFDWAVRTARWNQEKRP